MIEYDIPVSARGFFASQYFLKKKPKNLILACSSEELAIVFYHQILFFTSPPQNIFYLPTIDTQPYDRISPKQTILSERARILTKLALNDSNNLLITNVNNLLIKLPPRDIFKKSNLVISLKMTLAMSELIDFLIENGFTRSSRALDSGEFALRGDIVDIVQSADIGYRINFLFGCVESIKQFDLDTQISFKSIDELSIGAASEITLDCERISNFKENYLKNFGAHQTKNPLYESIMDGRKFSGYENLLALFYDSMELLTDYLPNASIIHDDLSIASLFHFEENYKDLYNSRVESNKIKSNNFYPPLHYSEIYCEANKIQQDLLNQIKLTSQSSKEIYTIDKLHISNFKDDLNVFDKLLALCQKHKDKKIIICCSSKSHIERLKPIVENHSIMCHEIENISEAKHNAINLNKTQLHQGFYNKEYLFISSHDIFEEKLQSRQNNSQRTLKNILAELDNLTEGELVVHKNHGIGRFIKIETLKLDLVEHDFLKILYENDDKLYIPVENIDVIKKYGGDEAPLDRLGGTSWQRNKAKAKHHITELAVKLLELSAKRKLNTIQITEFDSDSYEQFCRKFIYPETEDQLKATEDIKNDLQSGILMDRLICGDVGFGKTEVAMRATFMIAQSVSEVLPQVVIVVPTTILCKQHYLRFTERFQDFGLNIVQLSSLISPLEAKKTRKQIKDGSANIIVGTHAVLSKNTEFYNLKLLIIDEEQHFGVMQKERLKELKSEIHVLSLSATPIPRTLQMSMVGIKDLSLIATPPIDRLEVRTNVMIFDPIIIRDALLKERSRGGRSFYVVPRIKDIADIEQQLQKIAPELKYKIAHGQMLPAKIDETMTEFCNGNFDILISTNVVESGIDIAEANTMIIHRPQMFSLSSLYQLRGRIGRSKTRGYAYLILPPNLKTMTKHSTKRLEIIQNTCSLGSGFTISTHKRLW